MLTTYRYSPVPAPNTRPASSVSLVFTSGSGVLAVALREGQPLVVGRGAPSDVVVDDVSLSRAHARFQLTGGTIHVEDLGSTNGTLVDGKPIGRATLAPEQSARLGGVEVGVAGHARALLEQATPVSSFGSAVCDELVRARFFGRNFAVVAVMSRTTDRVGDALQRMLRPVDVLEQQAPHLALLLLPEASEPEVLSLAEALHRSEPGLYRVGASVFPTLASSAEELIADSLRAARDARAQQVNFSRTVAPSAQRAGEPIVIAPSMKRVHALIASAARTTIPVLIAGETGSGKESLATAVHHQSARRKGPLKTVNCAALPSALISSTLFGHEKGAFTGADRQSLGLFEQADGGTLFLDEVGELSLEAQAALLRALETKRIVRVGGNKEIEVDVRLVAATHRDLSAMVVLGTFREDLLYRLDAFTVRVPPLRERREEIIPLAQHFLALSQARWHSSATTLAEAVGHTLERYAWPGNARQLRNVIERAAAVCRGSVIELDDLPDAIFDTSRAAPQTQPPTRPIPTASVSSSLPDRLRQIEEQILREALDKAGGNQSEAARSLGLPRRTLAHKVHAYGLAATSERPA